MRDNSQSALSDHLRLDVAKLLPHAQIIVKKIQNMIENC